MDRPTWLIALGRPEALRLTAYGVLLMFLGVGVFSAVTDVDTSAAQSLMLLVAFVATIVLHELVHGLCFLLFGGSPKFGVGLSFILPFIYTTSEGERFDARQMSIIGLAPLVTISAGALIAAVVWPFIAPYALVGFLTNLSGSVGDIWLVALLWRFARLDDVTFEDRKTGVAVWTDDENVAQVTERLERGTDTANRFAAQFLVATVVIFLVTNVIGIFATLSLPEDQAFRIGPAALPLFEKEPTNDGLLVSISLSTPVIGGLLFAGLSLWFRRRHPRSEKGSRST